MPFAAAAVVGAGLTAFAASQQADAATSAAQMQANAANQATAAQLQMFNQTQTNLAPFLAAGTNVLPALLSGLGFTAGTPTAPATPAAAATPAPSSAPAPPITATGSTNYLAQLTPDQFNAILSANQPPYMPGTEFQPIPGPASDPNYLRQILSGTGMSAADQSAALRGITLPPGLPIPGSVVIFGGPQSPQPLRLRPRLRSRSIRTIRMRF